MKHLSKYFSHIRKLLWLLNLLQSSRKFEIFIVFLFLNFCGLLELLSLASIIPITSFLLDPESSWFDFKFLTFISWLDLSNDQSRALFLLGLAICVFFLSSFARIYNLYSGARLSADIGIDLSKLILQKITSMEYLNFTQTNSSELIALVNDDVDGVVAAFISLLQFMTSFSFALFSVIGLVFYSPQLALPLITVYSLFYLIYIFIGSRYFVIRSHKVATYRVNALKNLQNIFGAFREMFVYKLQSTFISAFVHYNTPAKIQAANNFVLTSSPKIVIEALAIITLLSIAIFQFLGGTPPASIVISIGVLALASQRLLPAFQQMSLNFSVLSIKTADISRVWNFLNVTQQFSDKINLSRPLSESRCLYDPELINFSNVSFSYPNSADNIITLANLSFEAGKCYGIVGASGSGKSTLIDLILGLLKPQSGYIISTQSEHVSSSPLRDNLARRSKSLSFGIVPQQVFLADATVLENIALGVHPDSIDFERVRKAASTACIDEFILTLPNAYETNVGERGVLLSGGQVQRIGIARSLYYSSDVLILDEATSALDQSTEAELLSNIYSDNSRLTIIMIAHRLATLSRCDKIIHVSKGTLTEYLSLEHYRQSFS